MENISIALSIHLIGATSLALLLVATVGSLVKNFSQIRVYKLLAVALAITTAVEVVSGTAMYLLATDASLISFCGKMAVYLSITALAEYALLHKIRITSATVTA